MSFLSPLALSLFALSVPLVLLYFLKVRRRERTVSSLLLWSTALRDREASTFFQRLHRDPLLLLQLLALLALALALARPVATVMGQGARKVVVVLDTSASMKAQDVSPSRFEVARAGALSLVRGLGEGAEVMVIEAGVQARPLLGGNRRVEIQRCHRGISRGEGVSSRAAAGANPHGRPGAGDRKDHF